MSRRHGPRGKSHFFTRHREGKINFLKKKIYILKIFINFLEQSQSSESGHGGAYSRRPPGLKGKEIGLYYRNKNREKAQKKNTEVLKLLPQVEHKIKSILNDSKTFYNGLSDKRSSFEYSNNYDYISDSQFKRKFLEIINGDIQHSLAKAMIMESKLQRNNEIDRTLLNEYKGKQIQNDYLNMLKFRMKLPAYHKKAEILKLVENNQVIVISGETGEYKNCFLR